MTGSLFDARRRLFDWANTTDETPVGRDVLIVLDQLDTLLAVNEGLCERNVELSTLLHVPSRCAKCEGYDYPGVAHARDCPAAEAMEDALDGMFASLDPEVSE